jgi:phenylalanyl-tRNA synthetase beta chain
LSIRGLAREVAAVCGLALREAFHRRAEAPLTSSRFAIRVEAGGDCPLYTGIEMRGVRVGASPEWLRARLAAAGQRSINNVVDVTNYLLLDRGQPLHAFDTDRLSGTAIVVRAAAAGEEIETLDGQTRKLDAGDLLIADGGGAIALAGVMGGARSAVSSGTTALFLESAMFRPGRVRSTSRRLGLISESSYRFERGVDPAGVEATLLDAARMIAQVAGGEIVGGVARGGTGRASRPPVRIRPESVERILGVRVERRQIERIVRALGATIESADDEIVVGSPTHRHDLEREIDWIEEIARLTGYDSIAPAVPVMAAMEASVPPLRRFAGQVRERMAARGLTEIVSLAFCDEARNRALPGLHASGGSARLRNPLRSDAAEMRRSVLSGLFDAHALNVRGGARTTDLFTIGRTFAADGAPEREVVGGLLWGPRRARRPGDAGPAEFWDVKAAIEAIGAISGAHAAMTWRPDPSRPEYHPRECAALVLAGEVVGYAGRIHPELADTLGIERDVYAFEVDSLGLATYAPPHREARSVPRFPSSRRDVSLLVPDSLLAGDIVAAITGSKEALVEEAWVFDEYEGEGIAAGERALGVAIVYRAADRTLTDAEVVATHDKVVAALCKALPVRPRL